MCVLYSAQRGAKSLLSRKQPSVGRDREQDDRDGQDEAARLT